MSGSEDDTTCYCDWCARETKRRSLVMGGREGQWWGFKWGEGELICAKCLKNEKPRLYLCKFHGMRQIFCTEAYYDKYWKDDSKVKVMRTPQDHQEMLRKAKTKQQTKKNKPIDADEATTNAPAQKRMKGEKEQTS